MKKKEDEKEVIIREGEYKHKNSKDETQEIPTDEILEKLEENKKPSRLKITKRIKICIIAIVLAVISIFIYVERANLTVANFSLWFRTNVLNSELGEGFPISINGSSIDANSVYSYKGNLAVLSDTSFTIVNKTGNEVMSFLHNYENPVMTCSGGRYLIYNVGSNEYTVVSSDNSYEKFELSQNITSASISQNGAYVLITQPSDFSSTMTAYTSKNEIRAVYDFANSYANAVKISDDGNSAMLASLNTSSGVLYSNVAIYNFYETSSSYEYSSQNNLILEISYNDGVFHAIGDSETISFKNDEFTILNYENERLTAYDCGDSYTLISVSEYDGDGACTLYALGSSTTPSEFEFENTVEYLSSYGTTFCATVGEIAYSYHFNGLLLGTAEINYDTKNISLCNESAIYIIGLKTISLSNFTNE